MAILFTEGFGIYGSNYVGGNFQMKYDVVSIEGASLEAGRHATGSPNYCLRWYGNTAYLEKDLGTNVGTVIVGMAIRRGGTSYSGRLFSMHTAAGVEAVYASWTPTGEIQLNISNPAAVNVLVSPSVFELANTWYYVEMRYSFNNAAAPLEIRRNGLNVASTIYNTTVLPHVPSKIRFYGRAFGSSPGWDTQDIYVLDTTGIAPTNDFLGDVRIETLFPNAPGNKAEWDPNPVTNLLTPHQALLDEPGTGWIPDPVIGYDNSNAVPGRYASSGSSITGQGYLLIATSGVGVTAASTSPQGVNGIPVTAGLPYSLACDCSHSLQNSGQYLQLGIRWFNSAGTEISTTFGTNQGLAYSGSSTSITQKIYADNLVAPAGAETAVMIVRGEYTNNSTGSGSYIVDHIQMVQAASSPPFTTLHYAVAAISPPSSLMYLESDTAGETEIYGHANLTTVSANIIAVRPAITLARTTAGPRTIGAVARINGSEYVSGTTAQAHDTINTYKTRQSTDFVNNPATNQPWTVAEINAAEFGFKIVS